MTICNWVKKQEVERLDIKSLPVSNLLRLHACWRPDRTLTTPGRWTGHRSARSTANKVRDPSSSGEKWRQHETIHWKGFQPTANIVHTPFWLFRRSGRRSNGRYGGQKSWHKEGTTKFGLPCNWLTDPMLVAEIGGKPRLDAARSNAWECKRTSWERPQPRLRLPERSL